jgi:hypothetical protein
MGPGALESAERGPPAGPEGWGPARWKARSGARRPARKGWGRARWKSAERGPPSGPERVVGRRC